MAERSSLPRRIDIIEAIERLSSVTMAVSLDAFEADWQKRWLIERGIEIISEASRRLADELKARHRRFRGRRWRVSAT
jgi:uncharacterized protein with HEPN domain